MKKYIPLLCFLGLPVLHAADSENTYISFNIEGGTYVIQIKKPKAYTVKRIKDDIAGDVHFKNHLKTKSRWKQYKFLECNDINPKTYFESVSDD